MAQEPASVPRSALVLFVKKNWKWLLLVVAVAVFVMMVASD